MDGVLAIFRDACDAYEVPQIPGPESLQEARFRLQLTDAFIAENSSGVVGWSALPKYHPKNSYCFTAELWVYVARPARKMGIGRTLARRAIERAQARGLRTLILFLLSEPLFVPSSAKSIGFKECGRVSNAFLADDRWRDLIALQLNLDEVAISTRT